MRTRSDAIAYVTAETDKRGRVSQRGRIIRLLLSASEVPLPSLMDLRIAQLNTRILELRRLGFDIRNRTNRAGDSVHSVYWLLFDQPASAPEPASRDWYTRQTGKARQNPPPDDFGPLFGSGGLK